MQVAPAGAAGPRLVRWRGVLPLALFLALLAAGYWLFIDRIVEETVEEASTELLGTAVELDDVTVRTGETAVRVGAIRVADPFDPMRNLIETGAIEVELVPEPLLQRKVIIRRLRIGDVQFGTRRATPAPPVQGDGFAPQALRALRDWRAQFDRPLLAFTPIDTLRDIALDPSQLVTVQAATRLAARADSVKDAVDAGLRALALQQTLDTVRAVLARLDGANPVTLGIAGTRQAVADVKRAIDDVSRARARIEALERDVRAGVTILGGGVEALDDARKQDYAFARGLLELPTLEGPRLSQAVFGDVSLDRMQQAVYWAELAQQYLPPGLRPREDPGPERLRRAGTTVRFQRERAYPDLALQSGEVEFALGDEDGRTSRYVARLADLSSAPVLTGRPMRFAVRPVSVPEHGIALELAGELDHRTATIHDRVVARVRNLRLPGVPLPVFDSRLEPGRGASELRVALEGDRIEARWSVRSEQVRWLADTAALRALNTMERLVWRILSGVRTLALDAELEGTLREPRLAIRSNLDAVLADRLRAVAGEELARAEARARAEVDRIVEERTAPVRARVAEVRADVQGRVDEARTRLDEEKRTLEAQLDALTGGLGGALLRRGT